MFTIFFWFAKVKVIETWLEEGMLISLLELVTPIFKTTMAKPSCAHDEQKIPHQQKQL